MVGRADDTHRDRAALGHMGVDRCGVEIRVPHAFLKGLDVLPPQHQMGGGEMAKWVATCRFGEARAINGCLHGL